MENNQFPQPPALPSRENASAAAIRKGKRSIAILGTLALLTFVGVGAVRYVNFDNRQEASELASVPAKAPVLTLSLPAKIATVVGDNVEQDGANIKTPFTLAQDPVTTLRIGTFTNVGSSYTGLRFGSQAMADFIDANNITQASVELTSAAALATTGVSMNVYVSLDDNSKSFSAQDTPSLRIDDEQVPYTYTAPTWVKASGATAGRYSIPVTPQFTDTISGASDVSAISVIFKGTSTVANRFRTIYSEFGPAVGGVQTKPVLKLRGTNKSNGAASEISVGLASTSRVESDGLNQMGSVITDPGATLPIGALAQPTETYTGLRFTGIPTAASYYRVKSATLVVTPNANQTTQPINVQIFAEKSELPEIFSSLSLPSTRTSRSVPSSFTITKAEATTTKKWTAKTKVGIPVTEAVRDAFNANPLAPYISLIIKSNAGSVANVRRTFHTGNTPATAQYAPQLVVELEQVGSTATIPSINTLQLASIKVTAAESHATQNSVAFVIPSAKTKTLALGTYANAANSWIGFQFSGLSNITNTHVIDRAQLQLVGAGAAAALNKPINVTFYGQKSAYPAPLSKVNLLSAPSRSLTSASSVYAPTTPWVANQPQLIDVTAPVKEAIVSPLQDQLTLIAKGAGAANINRTFHSDYNATYFPTLKVTARPKNGGTATDFTYRLAPRGNAADIVSQYGAAIAFPSTATTKLGSGGPLAANDSYTAFRFFGVPSIPTGYKFGTAKLYLTSSAASTKEVDVSFYTEKSAFPMHFTLLTPPSGRQLNTTASNYYANGTTNPWAKNQTIEIDVSSTVKDALYGTNNPVQDHVVLVAKSNKKNGLSRLFFNGQAVATAPRLVITLLPSQTTTPPVQTPTINSFSINGSTGPLTVNANQALNMAWSTSNVTFGCQASGTGWTKSGLSANGTDSAVAPGSAGTYQYTLTCVGSSTVQKVISVTVSVPSTPTPTPQPPSAGTGNHYNGPNPPASAKKVNVLDLRYYSGGATQEATYRSYHDQANQVIEKNIEQGTRYRGYQNTTSAPIVDVVIRKTIKRNKALPNSVAEILSDKSDGNDICALIASQQIDHVWLWLGGTNTSALADSPGSFHMKFDYANSICKDVLGVGARSVAFINHAYNHDTDFPVRNPDDVDLHPFAHSMEDWLSRFQGDLFTSHYAGVGYGNGNVAPQQVGPWGHAKLCGNAHWAPNSNQGYIVWSPTSVSGNTCESWQPYAAGATKSISCVEMGSCTQGKRYYAWWTQNMPGKSPVLSFDPDQTGPLTSKLIPPWNEFISDWDTMLEFYGRRSEQYWVNKQWIESYNSSFLIPEYIEKVVSIDRPNSAVDINGNVLTSEIELAGSGRLLLVAVAYGAADGVNGQVSSVTGRNGSTNYNFVKANSARPPGSGGKNVEWWYLSNAPSSVSVTITTANTQKDILASIVAVPNVNNSSSIHPSPIGSGDGNGSRIRTGKKEHSLSVPSANGEVAFFAFTSYTDSNNISAKNEYSKIVQTTNSSNATVLHIGAKRSTGTSSLFEWRTTNDWFWASSGISVRKL